MCLALEARLDDRIDDVREGRALVWAGANLERSGKKFPTLSTFLGPDPRKKKARQIPADGGQAAMMAWAKSFG